METLVIALLALLVAVLYLRPPSHTCHCHECTQLRHGAGAAGVGAGERHVRHGDGHGARGSAAVHGTAAGAGAAAGAGVGTATHGPAVVDTARGAVTQAASPHVQPPQTTEHAQPQQARTPTPSLAQPQAAHETPTVPTQPAQSTLGLNTAPAPEHVLALGPSPLPRPDHDAHEALALSSLAEREQQAARAVEAVTAALVALPPASGPTYSDNPAAFPRFPSGDTQDLTTLAEKERHAVRALEAVRAALIALPQSSAGSAYSQSIATDAADENEPRTPLDAFHKVTQTSQTADNTAVSSAHPLPDDGWGSPERAVELVDEVDVRDTPPHLKKKWKGMGGEFKCNKCVRSFATRGALGNHLTASHSKGADSGTIYMCQEPNCSRQFTSEQALKNHSVDSHDLQATVNKSEIGRKVSSGGVQYHCGLCQRAFNLHSHLAQHMAHKHDLKVGSNPHQGPVAFTTPAAKPVPTISAAPKTFAERAAARAAARGEIGAESIPLPLSPTPKSPTSSMAAAVAHPCTPVAAFACPNPTCKAGYPSPEALDEHVADPLAHGSSDSPHWPSLPQTSVPWDERTDTPTNDGDTRGPSPALSHDSSSSTPAPPPAPRVLIEEGESLEPLQVAKLRSDVRIVPIEDEEKQRRRLEKKEGKARPPVAAHVATRLGNWGEDSDEEPEEMSVATLGAERRRAALTERVGIVELEPLDVSDSEDEVILAPNSPRSPYSTASFRSGSVRGSPHVEMTRNALIESSPESVRSELPRSMGGRLSMTPAAASMAMQAAILSETPSRPAALGTPGDTPGADDSFSFTPTPYKTGYKPPPVESPLHVRSTSGSTPSLSEAGVSPTSTTSAATQWVSSTSAYSQPNGDAVTPARSAVENWRTTASPPGQPNWTPPPNGPFGRGRGGHAQWNAGRQGSMGGSGYGNGGSGANGNANGNGHAYTNGHTNGNGKGNGSNGNVFGYPNGAGRGKKNKKPQGLQPVFNDWASADDVGRSGSWAARAGKTNGAGNAQPNGNGNGPKARWQKGPPAANAQWTATSASASTSASADDDDEYGGW